MNWSGNLQKLKVLLKKDQAIYFLGKDELNKFIGKRIEIKFLKQINCRNCQRQISKIYGDGFCYPCFSKLACCDICIIKPELCHFNDGTCRDAKWGIQNCFADHIVYISYTSNFKIGITRYSQVPTRWIDQGAIFAKAIFKVANRKISGEIEQEIAKIMNDKSSWQKMLKTNIESGDINGFENNFKDHCNLIFDQLGDKLDLFEDIYADDLEFLDFKEAPIVKIVFPRIENKILEKENIFFNYTSLKLSKENCLLQGKLLSIKGQYLMLDTGVFNVRRHSGYNVEFNIF